MRDAGIGVFDSGIGGLTVFKALRAALPPGERLLYLGDTARVPYGTKSAETVVRYALEGSRFLGRRGIKALVIACNTMSAVALEELRKDTEIPVVGVIGPGAEAACRATGRRVIGVIGTAATIKSGAYTRAIARHLPQARVVDRACPLFVPLAEEGWVDNEVARATAALYLQDFKSEGIDTLVLGCTHYPLLEGVIGEAVGPGVVLVDSARATASVVRARLLERGLLAEGPAPAGEDHFFVTDSSDRFREVGSRFLGGPLLRLEQVDIQD
ncbi:MAG: glutamate racemase [Acidobacteria bacterium]|nr:MAG: glutamate racemase [Acidobacteriota bacterium]